MTTTETRDTRERLLDAAEQLFGERGITAVSIRDITSAAGANIAAVNYHFGGRDALMLEVLKRRMEPLNARRLELLDEIEAGAGNGSPTLEAILGAFIAPTFTVLRKNPAFMKFIGQLHHQGGELAHLLLATARFQELIDRLRCLLLRSLPDAEPTGAWWGMSFVMGAMIHTWMKGREIRALSKGEVVYDSDEAMVERLTRFAAAGMRAMAGGATR